jgi:flagellar biosynthetic protein FliR
VALFLASLALGFISRTMPQLNILAAGFPIRTVLGLVMIISSLGMVGLLFQNSLTLVFKRIGNLFL